MTFSCLSTHYVVRKCFYNRVTLVDTFMPSEALPAEEVNPIETTVDEFRKVEKQIRQAAKAAITELSNSREAKKQRRILYKSKVGLNLSPSSSSVVTTKTSSEIYLLQSSIIDVDNHTCASTRTRELSIPNKPHFDAHSTPDGLFHPSAKLYSIPEVAEGFFILRNLIPKHSQRRWAKTCLREYSQAEHTNVTNLKALVTVSGTTDSTGNSFMTTEANSSYVDRTAVDNVEGGEGGDSSNTRNGDWRASLAGLRWASLGYHYDWTTRMYRPDLLAPIPTPLATLCTAVANLLNLPLTPEAAIINYYPLSGQMSGHIDDAEHCMDEPIVSVSLGCPAVFLLGGRTKRSTPVPVLLRSGDVVVMSGESRFCFHGIPTLLPDDVCEQLFPSDAVHRDSSGAGLPNATRGSGNIYSDTVQDAHLQEEANINQDIDEEEAEETFVSEYMRAGRINMNARRVTRLDGVWESKNGSGYKY